jgi:hypothetical protein
MTFANGLMSFKPTAKMGICPAMASSPDNLWWKS